MLKCGMLLFHLLIKNPPIELLILTTTWIIYFFLSLFPIPSCSPSFSPYSSLSRADMTQTVKEEYKTEEYFSCLNCPWKTDFSGSRR